jgi:hypothetical protein
MTSFLLDTHLEPLLKILHRIPTKRNHKPIDQGSAGGQKTSPKREITCWGNTRRTTSIDALAVLAVAHSPVETSVSCSPDRRKVPVAAVSRSWPRAPLIYRFVPEDMLENEMQNFEERLQMCVQQEGRHLTDIIFLRNVR